MELDIMLDTIDSSGIYIVIAIILTLAVASLLGLVLFASKEETFEDAIAAQKRKQDELLNSLQGGTKAGKSNKKWSRLKNKKANKKDVDEPEQDSGVDDEDPSTESIIAKVQAEEPIQNVTEQERKPKKSPKAEHPVKETEEKQEKEVPKKPKKNKSKKPVELAVEEEVVLVDEENVVEAGVSYPMEEIVVPIEDAAIMVEAEPEIPMEASPKKTKSNKNKQKEKSHKKGSILGAEKIAADIENAQLNSSEIQQVIDILLAKQNEQEQWKKPNQKADPLEQLKKRLQEKELQLAEGQQTIQNAANKNKELRGDIQQERAQRQSAEAQAKRYMQQAKEQETIRKRLEEQHLSEKQSMQTQIQRLQELIDNASQSELRQLQEENKHLKGAKLRAQQLGEDKNSLMNELSKLQQTHNQLKKDYGNSNIQCQQYEQSNKALSDDIVVYQSKIQSLQLQRVETEKALSSRLQGANDQIMKIEGENRTLRHELDMLKQDHDKVKVEYETVQQSAPPLDNTNELNEIKTQLAASEQERAALEASFKELQSHIERKDQDLKKAQADVHEITLKLEEAKSAVAATPEVQIDTQELEKLKSELSEKEQQIKELNLKLASLETAGESKVNETNEKIKGLEKENEEMKSQIKKQDESIDKLKAKNNDLREKNWKAMDAIGEAEKENKSKISEMQKSLYKGLKLLHPEVKIPKSEDKNLDNLFEGYNENLKEYTSQEKEKVDNEINNLKEQISKLNAELEALKNAPAPEPQEPSNKEEIKKLEEEKAHLKTVLTETESMLGRLKAGVDAEVGKWQKQVEDKDSELEDANNKIKTLENKLKQADDEKQALSQKQQETSAADAKVADKLKSLEAELEDSQKQKGKLQSDLDDTSAKLKKTISERDLLIREFKTLKTSSAKTEVNLKKMNDDQLKAAKKLLDQVTALENTVQTASKGDKEKDKIIKELYVEIEELKQEIRNEKDRVVVDIESPDSKVKSLESKLKAAEARIKELESSRSHQIETQIHDAMQQATANGVNTIA